MTQEKWFRDPLHQLPVRGPGPLGGVAGRSRGRAGPGASSTADRGQGVAEDAGVLQKDSGTQRNREKMGNLSTDQQARIKSAQIPEFKTKGWRGCKRTNSFFKIYFY